MQIVSLVALACSGVGSCTDLCTEARHPSACIGRDLAIVEVILASQIRDGSTAPLQGQIRGVQDPLGACRTAIESLARPLDPVRVDAVGAGPNVRSSDGLLRAPLDVRIVYSRDGAQEVRRSRVECQIDRAGRVVALKNFGESPPDRVANRRAAPTLEPQENVRSFDRGRASGREVVEAFYRALGMGDGAAASRLVVREKQAQGPLSASEISRYFGSLARPLRANRVVGVGASRFEVRYNYRIGQRDCAGTALVTLTDRNGETYIDNIRATEDCS